MNGDYKRVITEASHSIAHAILGQERGLKARVTTLDLDDGVRRHAWVDERIEAIDAGKVPAVLKPLKRQHTRTRNERLRQLIGYVTKFQDAMHYDQIADAAPYIRRHELLQHSRRSTRSMSCILFPVARVRMTTRHCRGRHFLERFSLSSL
ncbi:hypothetical protein ACFL6C_14755, partial [Myxococcota bacterium]